MTRAKPCQHPRLSGHRSQSPPFLKCNLVKRKCGGVLQEGKKIQLCIKRISLEIICQLLKLVYLLCNIYLFTPRQDFLAGVHLVAVLFSGSVISKCQSEKEGTINRHHKLHKLMQMDVALLKYRCGILRYFLLLNAEVIRCDSV